MPLSFRRSLRWKVRSDLYAWLNAAALEVNQVFNYCNETSFKAATRTDLKRKWMSGFDLCNLNAGATEVFDNIGADTIHSGWIPFKAASLKRKGVCLRFAGKCVRVFERERLEGVKWRAAA